MFENEQLEDSESLTSNSDLSHVPEEVTNWHDKMMQEVHPLRNKKLHEVFPFFAKYHHHHQKKKMTAQELQAVIADELINRFKWQQEKLKLQK